MAFAIATASSVAANGVSPEAVNQKSNLTLKFEGKWHSYMPNLWISSKSPQLYPSALLQWGQGGPWPPHFCSILVEFLCLSSHLQ